MLKLLLCFIVVTTAVVELDGQAVGESMHMCATRRILSMATQDEDKHCTKTFDRKQVGNSVFGFALHGSCVLRSLFLEASRIVKQHVLFLEGNV